MIGLIKEADPQTSITYIARDYVSSVLELSSHISHFVELNHLQTLSEEDSVQVLKKMNIDVIFLLSGDHKFARICKKAKIPKRIGSIRKLYNWRYCNSLIYDSHYRHSPTHIAEENINFLKALKINRAIPIQEMVRYCGTPQVSKKTGPPKEIILHPGSNLHTIEWPENYYIELANSLAQVGIHITITGSEDESMRFKSISRLCTHNNINNMLGKTSIHELIALVKQADYVISASTGISHIAAILGIPNITIFAPRSRQFDYQLTANKWKPIGPLSTAIQKENLSPKEVDKLPNYGINEIKPGSIIQLIESRLPHPLSSRL